MFALLEEIWRIMTGDYVYVCLGGVGYAIWDLGNRVARLISP